MQNLQIELERALDVPNNYSADQCLQNSYTIISPIEVLRKLNTISSKHHFSIGTILFVLSNIWHLHESDNLFRCLTVHGEYCSGYPVCRHFVIVSEYTRMRN